MRELELGDVIEVRRRAMPHFKVTGLRWEVLSVNPAGSICLAQVGTRGPRMSTAMWLLGSVFREPMRNGDLVVLGRVVRPHGAGQVHYIAATCSPNVKLATHAHTRDAELVSCAKCRQALEQRGAVAPARPEVEVDLWSYESKRATKVARFTSRAEAVRAAVAHESRCRLIEPWRDMMRMPRTLLWKSGGKRVQFRGPWAELARQVLDERRKAELEAELERYVTLLRQGPATAEQIARRLDVRPGRARSRLGLLKKAGRAVYEKRAWRATEAA